MEFESCFDIIGPIMVGPSSSHTAGVVSIGKFIHDFIDGPPTSATITFYDSFAATYRGHGTDKAIVAGLLGMRTDDARIKQVFDWAKKVNVKLHFVFAEKCYVMDHPNTVIVKVEKAGATHTIGGVSLGGGLSKIFLVNETAVDIRLSAGEDLEAPQQEVRAV